MVTISGEELEEPESEPPKEDVPELEKAVSEVLCELEESSEESWEEDCEDEEPEELRESDEALSEPWPPSLPQPARAKITVKPDKTRASQRFNMSVSPIPFLNEPMDAFPKSWEYIHKILDYDSVLYGILGRDATKNGPKHSSAASGKAQKNGGFWGKLRSYNCHKNGVE